MARRTHEDVRRETRHLRDREVAAFVDRFAARVKAGGTSVNPLAPPKRIRGPLADALRALSGMIRAGFANEGDAPPNPQAVADALQGRLETLAGAGWSVPPGLAQDLATVAIAAWTRGA